jgi:hypothetical protein
MGILASAVPLALATAENVPSPITPGPVTLPETVCPDWRPDTRTMTSLSWPGIL